MIRTEIRNDRGDMETLDHNDPRYWEGPYVYVPFPKLLFRITRPGQTDPEHAIVKSEHEWKALGSGWCESPDDAKAHFARLEGDVAKAAAESNYSDRHLSEKAKAERLAYERSTDEMVTDVPRKLGK